MSRVLNRSAGRWLALLLCVAVLAPAALHAAELRSPEIVVREIFDELLSQLASERTAGKLDDARAKEIFGTLLNPRIAYGELARWILRDHWAQATDEQRTAFLSAFEKYIINTYALALSTSQDIALDIEDTPTMKKRAALVDAKFRVEQANPVPIQFRLIERDGRWELFDVAFEGVSLALTFRSDFNYVAKNGGIDAVTSHLVQRTGG